MGNLNYYLITISLFIILSILEFFSDFKRVDKKTRTKSYITNFSILLFNNIILFIISTTTLYLLFSNYSLGLLNVLKINQTLLFILSFFLYDFLIYFWHYINHKIPLLWEFHKCHHSDKDLNTSTGFRFHIGELTLSLIYKSLTILIFGFSIEFIIFFEFIILYFSLFHHSNIKIPFEQIFNKIFVMPIHHATHHSTKPKEHHSNFGVVFSFWDKIFHTFNSNQPKEYGLSWTKQQNGFETIKFGFRRISLIILIIILISFLNIIIKIS